MKRFYLKDSLKLVNQKSKLIKKILLNNNIFDNKFIIILNKIFNEENIYFCHTKESNNNLFFPGGYTSKNKIIIYVEKDCYKIFQENIKIFIKELSSLLSHEMSHVNQYIKSNKKIKYPDPEKDWMKYISSPYEIEGFANTISSEIKLYNESDLLYNYLSNFPKGHKVSKKLLKTIYHFLKNDKKSINTLKLILSEIQ